ncbi:Phox (PX) domain-containing protein [Forsythia ovata]|uniref:Phox (PX) domain-containing protein n=1 Tax=Forsythia ovata TaxID=205694 RepID=A0ABD1P543_9LAMI
MNLYGLDYSLLDLGFADPSLLDYPPPMVNYGKHKEKEGNENSAGPSISAIGKNKIGRGNRNDSPPKHRHDGTSPLPLGMDWSPSPLNWDECNTVWPHDFRTGWSYCVTVPSWTILSNAHGSDPVVFYRVQVGLQSPEGVTTTRGILRRFSDFLKLLSDLKRAYPKKKLPPVPPKGLLRMRRRELLEERRCSLEDWMVKVLSDIDLSRSAPVACFLELEAAARSSFSESSHQVSDVNLAGNSDVSSYLISAGTSAITSSYGDDSAYETSELGTPKHWKDNYSELGLEKATSDHDLASPAEATKKEGLSENDDGKLSKEFMQGNQERDLHYELFHGRVKSGTDRNKTYRGTSKAAPHHEYGMEHSSGSENSTIVSHSLSRESPENDTGLATQGELWEAHQIGGSSSELSQSSEDLKTTDTLASSGLQFSHETLLVLPTNERQKMNRLLTTMQQRLATSKTDMEDLIARINQELAVRQYLTTKVKDLEIELRTTKQSDKETLEQAILIERERFTQMQWEIDEFRRKCLEIELKLKAEQDEKAHLESAKASIIQENEALREELDTSKEQHESLLKRHEESDLKSKADVKLLVREVKSLRSYQSELKQEVSRLAQERTEFERILRKERQEREYTNAANAKLLHECDILRSRLEECSVNFLAEEENKLKMDTLSKSDAVGLLATSDNRIGLLLVEAQLLAQDVDNSGTITSLDVGNVRTRDAELRKMLTDVLIDNAKLRKQVNCTIRCTLDTTDGSLDSSEARPIKTVLGKFL